MSAVRQARRKTALPGACTDVCNTEVTPINLDLGMQEMLCQVGGPEVLIVEPAMRAVLDTRCLLLSPVAG